jgi:hypothetical protein
VVSGWQPSVVFATLDNVRDGSAVNLKIESQIPSKVRWPENDQAPRWLSSDGSNANRADEGENQQKPAAGVKS